jgi:hypothetical protein
VDAAHAARKRGLVKHSQASGTAVERVVGKLPPALAPVPVGLSQWRTLAATGVQAGALTRDHPTAPNHRHRTPIPIGMIIWILRRWRRLSSGKRSSWRGESR